MNLVVFEDSGYQNLLPLVYSRATFNLRCGFDNLLAKIESAMQRTADALFVRPALAKVIAQRQTRRVNQPSTADDQLWVNGRWLMRAALDLPPLSAMWVGDALVAARITRAIGSQITPDILLDSVRLRSLVSSLRTIDMPASAGRLIDYPWQLVHENADEIVRQSAQRPFNIAGKVYPGAHLITDRPIHIGAGATIKPGAVLDTESGPIYIDSNVTINAGAVIAGPCFIGEECVIQSGASIRAGCSIGMMCKVGGEVEGTIFHGYSNKQHNGFLGHSYVGEWVNLGADTVGSDLKNTYGPVRVPINGREIESGQMFVGAFIGDHSKTAIGTRLPTGCVIGYGCNIAANGFTPKFVPSFSWLTNEGAGRNDPARALDVARKVVSRRGRKYSAEEESLFVSISEVCRKIELQI
jgi:UDP-N-acetylglucosamine diphosphorylase/glucosamine-1-phosphate N-acetyltransferase